MKGTPDLHWLSVSGAPGITHNIIKSFFPLIGLFSKIQWLFLGKLVEGEPETNSYSLTFKKEARSCPEVRHVHFRPVAVYISVLLESQII